MIKILIQNPEELLQISSYYANLGYSFTLYDSIGNILDRNHVFKSTLDDDFKENYHNDSLWLQSDSTLYKIFYIDDEKKHVNFIAGFSESPDVNKFQTFLDLYYGENNCWED